MTTAPDLTTIAANDQRVAEVLGAAMITIADAETRGAQIITDQGITLGHAETAHRLRRNGEHAEAAAFYIAAISAVSGTTDGASYNRRSSYYNTAINETRRANADAMRLRLAAVTLAELLAHRVRIRIDSGEPVNAGGGSGPQTRTPDEMREINATLCERCQRDDPHNPGAGRACPGPAYIDGRDARDSCSCGCHDYDD